MKGDRILLCLLTQTEKMEKHIFSKCTALNEINDSVKLQDSIRLLRTSHFYLVEVPQQTGVLALKFSQGLIQLKLS